MASYNQLYDTVIKSFDWHSSPIDWCEPNYQVTSSVVEFYNTISNAIFIILPPVLMYLFHPYGRRVTYGIQFVWALEIFIGIASAYFHGTLTLSGQLLDEFGIIWVMMACLAFWFPRRMLPESIKYRKNCFELVMLFATIALTLLGCVYPILNSFIMMCFSIPILVIVKREMNLSDKNAKYVAKQSILLWFIAVLVWVSDRFLCGAWLSVGLPGGHWLWHLIVGFSTYRAIVFFVYRDAVTNHADTTPVLTFWPSNEWKRIGLPYIDLQTPLPMSHNDRKTVRTKMEKQQKNGPSTMDSNANYYTRSSDRGRHHQDQTSRIKAN